jgi:hypothetical protein
MDNRRPNFASVAFAVLSVLAVIVAGFYCTRGEEGFVVISVPFWSAALLFFLAANGLYRAAFFGFIGGVIGAGIGVPIGFFVGIVIAVTSETDVSMAPIGGAMAFGFIGPSVGAPIGLAIAIIVRRRMRKQEAVS